MIKCFICGSIFGGKISPVCSDCTKKGEAYIEWLKTVRDNEEQKKDDKVWFCPKCGRDRRKPYDENGEMVPCCNPKCGGLWGTGCYCCHHPKYLEEDGGMREGMRRVIIESPLAGNVKLNTEYARVCMRDSLRRGEAPFASHLLYTQVLDDLKPEERKQGMEAGFTWNEVADLTVVYTDLGVSEGMKRGIETAKKVNRPVEFRQLFKSGSWEAWAEQMGLL